MTVYRCVNIKPKKVLKDIERASRAKYFKHLIPKAFTHLDNVIIAYLWKSVKNYLAHFLRRIKSLPATVEKPQAMAVMRYIFI